MAVEKHAGAQGLRDSKLRTKGITVFAEEPRVDGKPGGDPGDEDVSRGLIDSGRDHRLKVVDLVVDLKLKSTSDINLSDELC